MSFLALTRCLAIFHTDILIDFIMCKKIYFFRVKLIAKLSEEKLNIQLNLRKSFHW